MADSLIGSLRVALSLGTADFEAGANKAASIARTKSKEMTDSFAGARRAVEGLLAAFAVGAITEQIKKSLDYAGSLAEVSRTLGLTTKDLQTFRFAATQSGVAQDQLEVGLRRLTVSMGKAELGSKAQQKAFGALGITVADLKGKTTGDVFRMMSDSLSKVTDRSQRAAVEMTLMGRSGSTLDNLLAPGSKRLNELAQAAQQLGIVLSDQQIQGAEETAHKLEAVKMVLEANIAGVVASNAGAILSLSSALANLTSSVIKFLGSNPQLALGIIGALAGGAIGRAGGVLGIGIGAIAGGIGGNYLGALQSNANTDLTYRTDQMRKAQADYIKAQNTPGVSNVTRRNTREALIEQIDLLKQATTKFRAQQPAPVAAPGVDLPKFLGGGDKQKKPKKAPEDKTEQDEFEFAQQSRQMDLQILEAKKALSHDYVEQTSISIQMLDIQKAIKNAELDHKLEQAKKDLAEKKITKGTYDELVRETGIAKAQEDKLDSLQRQAVLDAEQEQRFRDVNMLNDENFNLQKQKLQDEEALATTAKERRAIELKLLDIAHQQEQARLEAVIADKQSTDAEKEKARRDLVALNQDYPLQQQAVVNQTRGPLEDYVSQLPDTVAKFNEAVQHLEVQGIDELLNDITQLQGGFKSLLKTLLNTALQFVQGFAKLELQRGLSPLLQSLMGGAQGFLKTGVGNNMFGDLGGAGLGVDTGSALTYGGPSLDSLAASLPGYATGGSFTFRGVPGIDQNVLSMNGVPIARVSYGERAHIVSDRSSASDPSALPRSSVNMTVITPNADSFNRSGRQVVRQFRRTIR